MPDSPKLSEKVFNSFKNKKPKLESKSSPKKKKQKHESKCEFEQGCKKQ